MSKFKLGDKVRVKDVGLFNANVVSAGDIGIVKSVDSEFQGYRIYIDFNGNSQTCMDLDDCIELVKFTKADLKDGMRVYYKTGSERIVFDDNLYSKGAGRLEVQISLSGFRDDLSHIAGIYEIIKVTDRDGTVLFERPPVKRKIELELTDEQYEALKRQFDL